MDILSNEERELKSILEVNLDGLESLGLEDASFREVHETAPVTFERRMASSLRLKRMQEAWDNGRPNDNPSGLPMARGMERQSVPDRTITYKATLLKVYDSSIPQVRELHDLICLGEISSIASARNLVGTFLDVMEKDRNILLALCLYQSPNLADYLYRHAVNMCLVSLATAAASGFSRSQVLEIGIGGLLADVGMAMVPEAILLKSGKLTEEEFASIHIHTSTSFALLEKIIDVSDIVLSAAYQHHERLSGSGYPKRRSSVQISQTARIVAIADTLCAMVHKRSHRDALTPQGAIDKVVKMGQMNFLDATCIKNLIRYLSIYPIGTFVELSSGRMGRVIASNPEDSTRPVISILRNEKGITLPLRQILQVDLLKEKSEKIVKAVDSEASKFKPLDGF
jgi:HD-GYP domain-containing protein (c-di-GMP phosphodiesterase class II)